MAVAPKYIVGIDLGTTHTVVAWLDRRRGKSPRVFHVPQLVAPGQVEARPLLPSFLYAPLPDEALSEPWSDSPWIVGELAYRRGKEVPGRLVASTKSWLCHPAVDREAAILPWGSDDESPSLVRISPVDASTRLLAHVRRQWNDAFPEHALEKQHVILTVPASFDQAARELTLQAAHAAGLAVRLLEEPQAAFYDYMQRVGAEGLSELVRESNEALVLVVDIGGGTTDLTLILVTRQPDGSLDVSRVAVGRHLLLGGDNMDLALAHRCEQRLLAQPERLGAQRFSQLVLACRAAKERLLGDDPPEQVPITLLSSGSSLVGNTLSTTLDRAEAEQVVFDGFLPPAKREDKPQRGRGGLVAFGLPYEFDPAITRHVASFFAKHAPATAAPQALLVNGGLFRASGIRARLAEVIDGWGDRPLRVLTAAEPDLAVARGAVVYGLALDGKGMRITGGAAHGYFIGLDSAASAMRRAVCVVPKGAKEGERHRASLKNLALTIGRPVRFDLYASDQEGQVAGQMVQVDDEGFEQLPPVAASFAPGESASHEEVRVALEGELSAIGTLELACVEADAAAPRRFRLAFDLRSGAQRLAEAARAKVGPRGGGRLEEAATALDRVFGKGRADVRPREVKDLVRELERLLGERSSWTGELARALFDVIGPNQRARRRSADHERIFWNLAGYCLRPGYGYPLDPQRVALLAPLFEEGLAFPQEVRGWQQFWIAWRRLAGGLSETWQVKTCDRVDPFLAPTSSKLKKPKGFKPLAAPEMLDMASSLERLPVERKTQLGNWILEQTWTNRDPRLWAAMGRLGARVPTYASVHHVVLARTAERWLDHLLREKWDQIPTAARTAVQVARVTGDRARDVSNATRATVATRLERIAAQPEWVRAVREFVPVEEAERAQFFGEELPAGLRLVESA